MAINAIAPTTFSSVDAAPVSHEDSAQLHHTAARIAEPRGGTCQRLMFDEIARDLCECEDEHRVEKQLQGGGGFSLFAHIVRIRREWRGRISPAHWESV